MSQNNKMIVHATLKIRPGRLAEFCALMSILKGVIEQGGWKLKGCWTTMIGRINVVVDIWEVDDANQITSVFEAFFGHPNWPEWESKLAEYVEDEVTQIMTPIAF